MLSLAHISHQFDGKNILKDVTLDIAPKDRWLISGSSGCGKSTLLNIMAGLLTPSAGTVAFEGKNYSSLSGRDLDHLRGKNFGFLFQKLNLIGHLTALQNIEIVSQQPVDGALIDTLGLHDILHQKASSLSVGQAQRVALARAIAHNPAIIFADEPTSALDRENADKVLDLLLAQAEKTGAALVVTSHDERIQSRFEKRLSL
jgi:putative ABC transport system ATP-binding protein